MVATLLLCGIGILFATCAACFYRMGAADWVDDARVRYGGRHMSSMESLDKLQDELSGNVYGDAFHRLYKLSQDVSVEHAELMANAMKWVHKEKVEPLEAENAKLREMLAEDNEELAKMRRVIDYLYSFAKTCGVDAEDMRELGIEAEQ